jgi:hypothetical protein
VRRVAAALAKTFLGDSVTGGRAILTVANSCNSLIFLLFIFSTAIAPNIGDQARRQICQRKILTLTLKTDGPRLFRSSAFAHGYSLLDDAIPGERADEKSS